MKQAQALAVMMAGGPVFLTGPPGAGKTYVLNQFIKRASHAGKTVAVTASTGIAATHIGGTTIHSWSGLGIRDELQDRDRQALAANPKLVKRYNGTDVLVIDEVSMLHGKRLDMVNEVCKLLRKDPRPFGGMQVILVGDLFQLPPVTRGSEVADFAHTSTAWQELEPNICYLSEQHRQQQDGLLDLLEAMRRGEIEQSHEETIQARMGKRPKTGEPVTRLYAHNVDIDTINNRHLADLLDDVHEYEMVTKGAAAKVEQLRRSILAPETVELKKGAEVMFVANNPAAGFVNGTRGKVIAFKDEQPIVQLVSGRKISVVQHSWKLEEDGRVRAEVMQLPLRLAWAITIHKSQGMSLDAAEIDLSRSFTPGMGYVALSRVRSLDGLYLAGINQMALQMHPDIYELDLELRRSSAELATTTADVAEEVEQDEPAVIISQPLMSALRQWRMAKAQADSVPAYVIAHDSVLELVASKLPGSSQSLLGLKGFGTAKVDKYGDDILKLVALHGGTATKPEPEAVEPIDIVLPSNSYSEVVAGQTEQSEKGPTQSDSMDDIKPSSPDWAVYRQETIDQYPRAFKRWDTDEEALLLDLFWHGLTLEQSCAVLERQPSGLWARLHTLLSKTEN